MYFNKTNNSDRRMSEEHALRKQVSKINDVTVSEVYSVSGLQSFLLCHIMKKSENVRKMQ
jgi:hypothetical protein